MQRGMFCARKACAHVDDTAQLREQRVITIGTVESVIAIGPARENANGGQFA